MKKFVANRDVLLDMIADPAFYTTCPEFADLRDATLAAYADFKGRRGCCGGPVHLMIPSLDKAMERLHDLINADNRAALDRVRAFLSTKRRTHYDQVHIYYRKNSGGFPDRVIF